MKRTVKIDPYFDKQPPLTFVEELKKPYHQCKPTGYGTRPMAPGEVDAHGLYLAARYPQDPEGLLETIYADFDRFLTVYEIGGNRFPVTLCQGETPCFEAYRVCITAHGVTITANDTEGIRRGLIFLEDELRRRENAFLEPGTIQRRPYIHSRITRCFFSPINRPPKYGDELSDDIDYYPEEYLNRLMHDGSNGVWIYTRFSDLVPSPVIQEFGKGGEARIAKLNAVIEKCRRYGIGVYIFAIEPVALTPELAAKYPQATGTVLPNGTASFCVNTPAGKAHCYAMGQQLARLLPNLAGFISITNGERNTSCSNFPRPCTCPRCSQKKIGPMLSDTVEALCSGFRAVNPAIKVVSWTYGHRGWDFDDIREYVDTAPQDAYLMQNFDDMGYEEQLGKVRQCADYWLSYVGPSQMFRVTAEQAQKSRKHMFAKMQVCCSHEIASVPYIPVPGLVYKKFAGARALGVEGVMECWYFGNYPSLMSKAAGELSFLEDFTDKDGFLRSLAAIYWGNSRADAVVDAWNAFDAAYTQYPMNIMFSYYGPMHDSVVWQLALKPKNFQLPRTWQSLDPSTGDRISECMLNSHTIEETEILTGRMRARWELGASLLSQIESTGPDTWEQHSVANAINLLFASGKNIITFYRLREQLGLRQGDAAELLSQMRAIVEEEILHSKRMIDLCKQDVRLGYHSEAEGFKFFPQKLQDRIQQLEELLRTEFVEVSSRVAQGLPPLEYYEGIEDSDDLKYYTLSHTGLQDAPWEQIDATTDCRFRASSDGDNLYLEVFRQGREVFTLSPEYRLLWPAADVIFQPDGSTTLGACARLYYGLFGDRYDAELEKYRVRSLSQTDTHLVITADRKALGYAEDRPMKMKLTSGAPGKEVSWCQEDNPVWTLGKWLAVPGDYGWLMP